MTDEPQSSPNPTPNSDAAPRLWTQQLAEAFSWAEKHPVKLTAASIALPSVSLSCYLQSEHIPLSVLSSDVISGLPSLLVMICVITLALFAFALMPLMVMFEEAQTASDGSLNVLKLSENMVANIAKWILRLMLPGAILAISVMLLAAYPGNDKWGIPVAIILAGGVFTVFAFWPDPDRKIRHWAERTWSSIASNLIQMMLALFVMKGVLERSTHIENAVWIFLLLLLSMGMMALVQVVLLRLIEAGSKDGKIVERAFRASLIIIAVVCIFPPTGGWLAGRVVSNSASGGMNCLRLVVTGDKSDFGSFIDPGDKSQQITKELRMRAATSSRYYVRLKSESNGIGTIPSDRVSKFVECAPKGTAAKASPAPAAPGAPQS
ncbi:hypothetical protein [Stenotrophomonas sp. ZAC14A_NAIMI4_1]|uniref:hypothetical protein n=1 Tax=Stenotrophomonas sp. ZAC14A_NAIMI4_1 TaxID=2072412 RepID=UPI00131F3C4E|nr:hypothetical protein [Stenotrophomonas sp. ZAC14A_NAIMI4_1]